MGQGVRLTLEILERTSERSLSSDDEYVLSPKPGVNTERHKNTSPSLSSRTYFFDRSLRQRYRHEVLHKGIYERNIDRSKSSRESITL